MLACPAPLPTLSMITPLVPVASGAVVWPLLALWYVQVKALFPPARCPDGLQEKPVRVPPTVTVLPTAPALVPVPVAVKVLPEV